MNGSAGLKSQFLLLLWSLLTIGENCRAAPAVSVQRLQTKQRAFTTASLREGVCIAVVPVNDCDILRIDQLSGEGDRYGRQLIREVATGGRRTYAATHTQAG